MANGKSYSVLLGYTTLLRSPCVALQPAERWQEALRVAGGQAAEEGIRKSRPEGRHKAGRG